MILIPEVWHRASFESNAEMETYVDYPASSKDNEYVPVHCLSNGLRYGTTPEDSYLMYQLEFPAIRVYGCKKFANFSKRLDIDEIGWYRLEHPTMPQNRYFCSYGVVIYINDDNKMFPLLMLCVKKPYLFTTNRNNLDPNNFSLLVDRKFMSNPEHNKLYRNIKPHYLDRVEGIDVVYTDDIISRCFGVKSVTIPRFTTAPEMITHMRGINNLVLQGLQND